MSSVQAAFAEPWTEEAEIENKSESAGIRLRPRVATPGGRIDCIGVIRGLDGKETSHNWENFGFKPEMNFAEWDHMADELGLPRDGWQRTRQ